MKMSWKRAKEILEKRGKLFAHCSQENHIVLIFYHLILPLYHLIVFQYFIILSFNGFRD